MIQKLVKGLEHQFYEEWLMELSEKVTVILIILVALLWTNSETLKSFLCRGPQNWMQYSSIQTGHPQDNWPPELVDWDREQNSPPVIQEEAVSDLLSHFDAQKSMRPDGIHPRVMRELANELAKLVSIIYQQSWLTGKVPDDWRLASLTPIHKKGRKDDQGKYRPVILISVQARLWSRLP
ncbi:hypothetical protein WISP_59782 [Willisornis vidua]|uniref:RNA-directed DNA polymerase from mobile element jockey n=1 Tax=Willisornis vidua TaxID=1566151 RepID=A0ABQ9DDU4_9PASS|nr:hypothetical protein WISP_59782 [Willisornis vidua]